jgi:uncharacterized protein Veg
LFNFHILDTKEPNIYKIDKRLEVAGCKLSINVKTGRKKTEERTGIERERGRERKR